MNELKKAIDFLQSNDRNGTYTDILTEVEQGILSITDAKIECIEILQRLYNECVEGNNYAVGNKIASLAIELQKTL